jgi:hypothetical protein
MFKFYLNPIKTKKQKQMEKVKQKRGKRGPVGIQSKTVIVRLDLAQHAWLRSKSADLGYCMTETLRMLIKDAQIAEVDKVLGQ